MFIIKGIMDDEREPFTEERVLAFAGICGT
ncbi:hypothetical protein C823_001513 [Eubacterium plexicaudatum ASF492]|uniref:Uncharacterized protein n=1 Tax=Eubacterium plexicaudatum ASF492 TaxID=1235802 RepID=N2BDK7_9FIRM|nr:hypothetical protein C823_001513 [Eubacterium plexicaudatum ASF492]